MERDLLFSWKERIIEQSGFYDICVKSGILFDNDAYEKACGRRRDSYAKFEIMR